MGAACSMCRWAKKRIQNFSRKFFKEKDHLGDRDIDGRIPLKWLLQK
jgi:hypothetical protein